MSKRNILVTGVNGQVGFELIRSLQGLGNVCALSRRELDLSNPDDIRETVRRVRPSLIINPAAYTAVDKAESEQALAHQINAESVAVLAAEAVRLDVPVIQYSTDYVFNGDKEIAYAETDATDPRNVYGQSKLAAETALRKIGCSHLIIRTSWVYAEHGANFVNTMLRLGRERSSLRVVNDQYGAPTWARTIADVTAHIVSQSMALENREYSDWWREKTGIYHLTGTGDTNWAEFAQAIFEIKKIACSVEPIPASEFPTAARRPRNSRLSNAKLAEVFGIYPPAWRTSLELCLASM